MNKFSLKNLTYLIFSGTVLCSFIAFLFREQHFTFLPQEEGIVVKHYNDSLDGGNSKSTFSLKNNIASIQYSLENKYEFPYVGMSFETKTKGSYVDLSAYESIRIKLKTEKSKIVRISIRKICDSIPGHKRPGSPMNSAYELEYSTHQNEYEIGIEEFKTPTWWYQDNHLENGNDLNCTLEKVSSIDVENCQFTEIGVKDTIEIYELSAVKYNYWYLYILAVGGLAGIVVLIYNYTKSKKTVFVPYQATPEISNGNDVIENKVFEYIASHYANPELSLSVINNETGIAENKISGIIKSRYNQSFKQYINNIRMTEAKRLLKESEATISEIAYAVGYNNVTHFNRVFKSETGIAPGDFRREG